jgi:antitoxin component YwqK of YwqJK toxin-antitoxin module
VTEFYETGLKASEGWIHEGRIKLGTATLWHPNGVIKSKIQYGAKDEDFDATTWHDNGVKAGTGAQKNGKLHGRHEYFDRSGNLIRVEEYTDGVLLRSTLASDAR